MRGTDMNALWTARCSMVTVACTLGLLGGAASNAYSESYDLRKTLGPVALAGFKACTPSEFGYKGYTIPRRDEECEQFELWDDGAYKIKLWCRYFREESVLVRSVTVFDSHLRVTIDGNIKEIEPSVKVEAGGKLEVIIDDVPKLRRDVADFVLKKLKSNNMLGISICIRTYHGKYVTALPEVEHWLLRGDSPHIKEWERFNIDYPN